MWRLVGWVVAAVQVSPPSMERYTPAPKVPANRAALPAVRARMCRSAGCDVAAAQVRPPSVERNTPEPSVPATSVVPLAASEMQRPPGSPAEDCDHCAPVPAGPVTVLFVPQPDVPAARSAT